MKTLSKYKLKVISNNLDNQFNQATDQQINDGLKWYKDANKECLNIANRYDVAPILVASVISALSPRNKWEQNVKDTYTVFEAIKYDIHPTDVKVCTFHTNKFKAFNIAVNGLYITEASPKTYSFAQNIANLSNDFVTIDIWHLRACFNDSIKINNASIGKIAYGQISDLTIRKADKLGLTGFEYQAIIWCSVRNT